jgi:hypothetical protein
MAHYVGLICHIGFYLSISYADFRSAVFVRPIKLQCRFVAGDSTLDRWGFDGCIGLLRENSQIYELVGGWYRA